MASYCAVYFPSAKKCHQYTLQVHCRNSVRWNEYNVFWQYITASEGQTTARNKEELVELHMSGRWLSGSAWPFGWTLSYCNCTASFFFYWPTPIVGLYFAALWCGYSLLAYEVSWSHRTTRIVVRTPLDEWSARRRDLYLTTHNTHNKHPCHRWDSNPRSQQTSGRRPTP